MNHLQSALSKLKAQEKELQYLLELNHSNQEAIKKALELTSTNRPVTVAEKLGRRPVQVREGKVTIGTMCLEAIQKLEAPVDTKSIQAYVMEKDSKVKPNVIYAALEAGATTGLFKRLKGLATDKRIVHWAINESKKGIVQTTRAEHTRPNQGIGKRIIEEINKMVHKEKGRLFSAHYMWQLIKDDYPNATEMTVQSELNRLVVNKTPGFKKKEWRGDISYSANQPIKV